MKKQKNVLKIALFVVFTIISQLGFSQSEKLYVVINEASWCKYCKANGERVRKTVNDYASQKEILVLHNDVSDEASKKKLYPKTQSLGIYEYLSRRGEVAIVYVFDAKTKKIIDGFSIKSSDESIISSLNKALEKTNK